MDEIRFLYSIYYFSYFGLVLFCSAIEIPKLSSAIGSKSHFGIGSTIAFCGLTGLALAGNLGIILGSILLFLAFIHYLIFLSNALKGMEDVAETGPLLG